MKYIILLLLLSGCAVPRQIEAIQPLIVTRKVYTYSQERMAKYEFIDATGKTFEFYRDSKLWEEGDTIK